MSINGFNFYFKMWSFQRNFEVNFLVFLTQNNVISTNRWRNFMQLLLIIFIYIYRYTYIFRLHVHNSHAVFCHAVTTRSTRCINYLFFFFFWNVKTAYLRRYVCSGNYDKETFQAMMWFSGDDSSFFFYILISSLNLANSLLPPCKSQTCWRICRRCTQTRRYIKLNSFFSHFSSFNFMLLISYIYTYTHIYMYM